MIIIPRNVATVWYVASYSPPPPPHTQHHHPSFFGSFSGCDVDSDFSTVTISRLQAGCHKLTDKISNQDFYYEYTHGKVVTPGVEPRIEALNLYCDPACTACNTDATPEDGFGVCTVQPSIGSIAVFPPQYE